MVSPSIAAIASGTIVVVTALAATIAGLSIEAFLGLILGIHAIEFPLIVYNTANVSRLSGRYDADHE